MDNRSHTYNLSSCNSGLIQEFETKLCVGSFIYSLALISIYYPGCQRFLCLQSEATESVSGEPMKMARKNITNLQNDQLPNGLTAS